MLARSKGNIKLTKWQWHKTIMEYELFSSYKGITSKLIYP